MIVKGTINFIGNKYSGESKGGLISYGMDGFDLVIKEDKEGQLEIGYFMGTSSPDKQKIADFLERLSLEVRNSKQPE